MANVMLMKELRQLTAALEALNGISEGLDDISFGTIPVYDCNGENLGWIFMDNSSSYVFTTDRPED